MGEIVALDGSPLNVAVIGVEDMDASLHFYRDIIGLTAHDPVTWSGSGFESLWHIPEGASAQAVFCELPDCPVGRVLLLDFGDVAKHHIRPAVTPRAIGLVNLNFYTDDIRADTKRLQAEGYRFWSEPTFYEMSDSQGAPTEVVFDGPDSVAINFVELTGDDPNTRVGQMRAYVRDHGRTPTGFTPVVTTSHCVADMDKAVSFYEKVLKNGVLIDEIFDRPEVNRFLNIPEDGRTAIKFMQGNHMFGKIALSMPLNYECRDLTPDAVAPNTGYIAQMFEVKDLDYAIEESAQLGAETYAPPGQYDIPGLGTVDAVTVRNPGSGALQVIFKV
ncbi:MAG: VOC family protein [Rhodospirillaceae bacterium]|nr:VOC family protein [Rhodospirillaceae bacterium]